MHRRTGDVDHRLIMTEQRPDQQGGSTVVAGQDIGDQFQQRRSALRSDRVASPHWRSSRRGAQGSQAP